MKELSKKVETWKNSAVQVFWGEIAPCDHVVQIYETDDTFLTTLENFAAGGLDAKESVIIIGTDAHIKEINNRLTKRGHNIKELMESNQYFPLDASDTLAKFMVKDWPDEDLFYKCINAVIDKASQGGRKVRAFGEMVAILWAEGKNGATVRLENLWNQLHSTNNFALYCAYPKAGFTQNPHDSVNTICKAHSMIIDGGVYSATQIYYKNT